MRKLTCIEALQALAAGFIVSRLERFIDQSDGLRDRIIKNLEAIDNDEVEDGSMLDLIETAFPDEEGA